jgi:protein involved in polysaccharide export with SLBB domain
MSGSLLRHRGKQKRSLILAEVLRFVAIVFLCFLQLPVLGSPPNTLSRPLRTGDLIRIVCDLEPSLSVDRTIENDGTIKLPIVSRIAAAGKLIHELEDDIEQALARRAGAVSATVAITRLASSNRDIEFYGAVESPGQVSMRKGLKLSDIIQLAKPTLAADIEAIQILSADGNNLLVNSSDPAQDKELRPGDTIYFPLATQSNKVFVVGGVANPGPINYRSGLTLKAAIEDCGGLSAQADERVIRVTHDDGETTTINFSAGNNLVLRRGDVIQVPLASGRGTISVVGAVQKPGLIAFRPGMPLSEAIKRAGEPVFWADLQRIRIRRIRQDRPLKRMHDLTAIRSGKAHDPLLESGDVIDVPAKEETVRPVRQGRHPIPPRTRR